MYTTPSLFSKSNVGKIRALRRINAEIKDLCADLDSVESSLDFEVYFQGDWPLDEDGKKVIVEIPEVIAGDVKGARLKLNGKVVSRANAAVLLEKAEMEIQGLDRELSSLYDKKRELTDCLKRKGFSMKEISKATR